MLNGEPIYQIQHDRFILSFYADDIIDAVTVRRAAEAQILSAYQLRKMDPPSTLTADVAKIASRVTEDLHIR